MAVVGLVLVVVAVAIVELGTGNVPAVSALGDGAAWISNATGSLHVNGASGEPQEGLRFDCAPANSCTWVQRDGQAYSLNTVSGAARRVDGATLVLDQPVEVGSAGVRLAVGGRSVYAVDKQSGDVRSLDPETLQETARVTLDDAAGDVVADRLGRAWITGAHSGRVFVVKDATLVATLPVGSVGDDLSLGTVDGNIFVVNRAKATVARLTTAGADVTLPIDDVKGDSLLAGRDLPPGPSFVIDVSSGAIVQVDFDEHQVKVLGSIKGSGHYLAPVATGSRVVVLDTTSHAPHVFDASTGTEEKALDHATEVVAKDDFVYTNDPAGKAFVLDSVGRRVQVDKGKEVTVGGDPKPAAATTKPKAAPPPVVTPKKTEPTKKPTPVQPKPKVRIPDIFGKNKPKAKPKPKPQPLVATAPAKPAAPTAVAGADSVTVAWETPAGNPTSYIIRSNRGQSLASEPGLVTCSTFFRNCLFSGLQSGTAYSFTVVAVNSHGSSPPSEPSRPVTPSSEPPPAPTDVQAKVNPGGSVTVTWSAEDANVASFAVIPNNETDGDGAAVSVNPPAHDATFTSGLDLGKPYRFRVQVTTADGRSSESDYSNTVTPVGVPGAIGPVSADPQSGLEATTSQLTWAAVPSNGAAVSYRVKVTPSGATWTVPPTDEQQITFDLPDGTLKPGDEISATVTPFNDVGASAESAGVPITSYIDLAKGPDPAAPIVLTVDVNDPPGLNGTTYTFEYTIKNNGKAACLPTVDVVITPTAGTPLDLAATNICLKANETYAFKMSTDLSAGNYTYSAQWTDGKATFYPYGAGPPVEHPLTVP